MTSYKVEQIPEPHLLLGEGPHWDGQRLSLYYVSLPEATIHRLDYRQNKVYNATVEGCKYASFIIPVKGRSNEFVLGDGTRLVIVSWDGISEKAQVVKVLADLGEKAAGHRWNDGKVDSCGRLYAGTMINEEDGRNPFEANTGRFYRYDARSESFVEQLSGLFISNGLVWNDKSKKFFFIDSGTHDIKQFDVDASGNIVNGTVWFDLKENGKRPAYFFDGMTIDTEGNLYVAVFHGATVVKISPNGKIIQEIKIPAKQVTSVAFGGPNLDELYVTTAKKQVVDPQNPPAGATFKVTGLGVKGTTMNEVEL
ncbi:regucalcin-like [Topomyia yanbarensis]|uniref:regucalcin-like n=1 Tax=Topomyia yanbarensis TaxID=2498891 RepID=UPI00273AD12C|nr:regucalcin-like [Topomyia yanbarensis]